MPNPWTTSDNSRIHVSTPKALWDALDKLFHFDHDPCPLYADFDGLAESHAWGDVNFVNPPYNNIPAWVHAALRSGATTSVFLVPARVSSRYWHERVFPLATAIMFLCGRVRFDGYASGGPTPMCVIVFGRLPAELLQVKKLSTYDVSTVVL